MRALITAVAALALAAPAYALYKVVGPDGKVTYTDRPPTAETSSRVMPFKPGHGQPAEPSLPVALRQTMARHPVTLFTGSDCIPCDSARQLLQQRGVPYAEKQVASVDDVRAYEQRGGGRSLPGLSIGPQQLRGLDTAEWTRYLDAAGYPKTSALPVGWKPPAATPLAEPRTEPPTARRASAPPAAAYPTPEAPNAPPPAAPGTGTTLKF